MGKKFSFAAAFCILSTVLSLCLGAARLDPAQLWQALLQGPGDTAGFILWYVRLPRTAACLLSGCALAVSGAVIQNVLHNKLASPSIIGVNSGAGLGVTLACAAGAVSGWTVSGAAFLGALVTVGAIVTLSNRVGASRTTVILCGVAVNAFLNALSEGITTVIPEVGMITGDFRVGGFSAVSYLRLIPAGLGIGSGLIGLLLLHNQLDVLSLGEETAHGLGLKVHHMRGIFLALAALLAGCAVSFSGLLGFVGLIIPHAARKFAGSDSSTLLPMCALCGAGFVTFCDVLARLVFSPYELPVGILLAVVGGPFFLGLLLKGKGGRRYG
ncbi:MAG: iron ABC transporter permease [Oscillospiraceae bacterium]|nr:iron ABC transporter permease [Oscillospiraceae bacterium]